MNARELIHKLSDMPPDAEVVHLWDGEARTSIEHVWLSRGGRVVTSDYGMVCYSTDTRPVSAPTSKEDRYWESPANPKPEEW